MVMGDWFSRMLKEIERTSISMAVGEASATVCRVNLRHK